MHSVVRQLILFWILLLLPCLTFAQSPYQISWKKDLPLLLGGVGSLTTGILLSTNMQPYKLELDEAFSARSINPIDRSSINNWSLRAGSTSDIFLYSSFALPLTLMADQHIRKDIKHIGALYGETFLITQGLTSLTKTIVKRYRPYIYNEAVGLNHKESVSARLSFFSGHTATVSSFSFFTAQVFSDYHPDSPWKPVVWSAAAILPATTGFLRVRAGKHFPTDVIGGYLVGAAVGILVPRLHKNKKRTRRYSIKPVAGTDSFKLVYRQIW